MFDRKTEFVVTAFQRHFRPERVDGRIDQSTITTLERLIAALPQEHAASHEHRPKRSRRGAPVAADRLDARAVLVLVACCACWGINQVGNQDRQRGHFADPAGGRCGRCCRACWCLPGRARAASGCSSATARCGRASLPACCSVLEFVVIYIGLGYTTASRGIVFLYLAPFVVAFGAHYLIPGDRLTMPKVLGLTAALAGLAVAMGEGFAAPGRPTLDGRSAVPAGGRAVGRDHRAGPRHSIEVGRTREDAALSTRRLGADAAAGRRIWLGEPGIVELERRLCCWPSPTPSSSWPS